MKKFLEKLISRKQKHIDELIKRSEASDDIDEVRSIGQQIRDAQKEIDEARSKLDECNSRLDEARAEAEGDEGGEDQGEGEEEKPDEEQARARNFKPGTIVRSFDMRGTESRANVEKRAKTFTASGRPPTIQYKSTFSMHSR